VQDRQGPAVLFGVSVTTKACIKKHTSRLRLAPRIEPGAHPEDLARGLDINGRTVYQCAGELRYGAEEGQTAHYPARWAHAMI